MRLDGGAFSLADGEILVPDQDLFVVVPTIRTESIVEFLAEWHDPDLGVRFVVIHDAASVPDDIPISPSHHISHWCWGDIANELGDDEWIIPRKTDCVRSFGFLKAKRLGAKYIVSMDDDVRPQYDLETFWKKHLAPLVNGLRPTYCTTYDRVDRFPRGLPLPDVERELDTIPVGINHGLWDGVLDRHGIHDATRAETRAECGLDPFEMEQLSEMLTVVPRGFIYPMCGMNVSFDVDVLAAMHFTLQGHLLQDSGELEKLPYDRWGDIWCGLISKAILDLSRIAVTSGAPHVLHDRLSNPASNIQKEKAGFDLHGKLTKCLAGVHSLPDLLPARSRVIHALGNIGDLDEVQSRYMQKLISAMAIWGDIL